MHKSANKYSTAFEIKDLMECTARLLYSNRLRLHSDGARDVHSHGLIALLFHKRDEC